MKTRNISPSRRWPVVFLAASVMLGAGGCTQVMVSPEVRGDFKLGEVQVFVDRDLAAVQAATKQALKDLSLFETGEEQKPGTVEISSRDGGDTRVTVKLLESAKNRTQVRIRYGLKGDLASAQKVYQAIEKRL